MNQEQRQVKWVRVSRENPCFICKKPDWCTTSNIGHCCMRVQSDRPAKNGGWMHRLDADAPPIREEPKKREADVDFVKMLSVLNKTKNENRIPQLASTLGVTPASLEAIGCFKYPRTGVWGFPMYSGLKHIVGIRLRSINGDKWAIKGSHQGLFMPVCMIPDSTVLICEGPTDTAAAISMGYYAIGRPSCVGCLDHIAMLFRWAAPVRRAVIVSDLDDAGLRGAKSVQEHLPVPSTILVCPAKDVRSFYNNGGSREMLDAMIGQQVWRQPNAKRSPMDRSPAA